MATKKDDAPMEPLSMEERMMRFQERQAEIQEKQLALQEQALGVQKGQLEQTKKKSLQSGPKISVFNHRGEKDFPMPALKCEIRAPWQSKPGFHGLTREEVELFNLLQQGQYPVELTDGSRITINVVGVKNSQNGTLEHMTLCGMYDEESRIYAALFTKENKQLFPAMTTLLRQMIGDAADGVMPMREELARTKLPADDPKHLAVSVGA